MLRLPALQQPHEPPSPGDRACHAVHRAVDHFDIHALPQCGCGVKGGPDDETIVGLVDVPFIERSSIQRLPPSSKAIRQMRVEHIDIIGGGDAESVPLRSP